MFVIIHHHIFKNAGTTLDFILQKNFGSDFANYDLNNAAGQITQEQLLKFLGEQENIKAISSHHFHGQAFKSDNHIFFDMIFLRHPLDRLRSMYDFYHANKSIDDPLTASAKKMSLCEYLDYLLQYHPHQVNNVQVNILANNGRYLRPPNKQDFSAAKVRLNNVSTIGTLCLFDEALVAAEYFLYPAFGKLDLSYKSQNVHKDKHEELQSRLEHIKQECGDKLYEQLLLMNQLDLKLLEHTKKEVCRRLKLVPDYNLKTTEFRNRCI